MQDERIKLRLYRALTILLVIGISVASVIGVEFVARWLLPAWAPTRPERVTLWQYDSLLGWAQNPGTSVTFAGRDYSVNVEINSQGLRDQEYSIDKSSKKRMLILGDSFGWGFGVEVNERFSEVIEERHPDWEIINASVSGYGTDQQFLYLRERGVTYKPDAVVLVMSGTDFHNNTVGEEYWYYKPVFQVSDGRLEVQNVPVPASTLLQRIRRFVFANTYLGHGILGVEWKLMSFLRGRAPSGSILAGNEPAESEEDAVTYHLVKAIAQTCASQSIQFFVVTGKMSADHEREIGDLAHQNGIPALILGTSIDSVGSSLRFPHDEHWNRDGHKFVADRTEIFLHESGLF